VNTDRWYYRVFQSAPDLIRSLLPGSETGLSSELVLDPAAPGDRQPRRSAVAEGNHRLAALGCAGDHAP